MPDVVHYLQSPVQLHAFTEALQEASWPWRRPAGGTHLTDTVFSASLTPLAEKPASPVWNCNHLSRSLVRKETSQRHHWAAMQKSSPRLQCNLWHLLPLILQLHIRMRKPLNTIRIARCPLHPCPSSYQLSYTWKLQAQQVCQQWIASFPFSPLVKSLTAAGEPRKQGRRRQTLDETICHRNTGKPGF